MTAGKNVPLTKAAQSQLAGAKILFYDRDMSLKHKGQKSWNEVVDILQTPEKDLMNTFVLSEFLPDDPKKEFAGGMIGSVLGQNGKRYNIVVSPDVEVNNAMAPYSIVNKFVEDPTYAASHAGKDVPLPSPWKYGDQYITKMRVYPKLRNVINSSGKRGAFAVTAELLDNEGSIVTVIPATDTWKLRQMGIQKASEYYRTRLGVSFQDK